MFGGGGRGGGEEGEAGGGKGEAELSTFPSFPLTETRKGEHNT